MGQTLPQPQQHWGPGAGAGAVVGAAVVVSELEELELETLNRFYPGFREDVYEALSMEHCVGLRILPGGPAPEAVMESIRQAWACLGMTGE